MYEKLDSLFFFLCLSHSLSLCSCLALLTVSVSHSVFKVCSAEEKKLWRTSARCVPVGRRARGRLARPSHLIRSAGFVDGFSVHYPLLSSSSLSFVVLSFHTLSLSLSLTHSISPPLPFLSLCKHTSF